jgi:hypothetical protein
MILKANTARGRQLIKQHGDQWIVLRECDRVVFDPRQGPWLFIAPAGHDRCSPASRWMHARDDKHLSTNS